MAQLCVIVIACFVYTIYSRYSPSAHVPTTTVVKQSVRVCSAAQSLSLYRTRRNLFGGPFAAFHQTKIWTHGFRRRRKTNRGFTFHQQARNKLGLIFRQIDFYGHDLDQFPSILSGEIFAFAGAGPYAGGDRTQVTPFKSAYSLRLLSALT